MSTFRGYSSYPRGRLKFGHVVAIAAFLTLLAAAIFPIFAQAHLDIRGGAVSLSSLRQEAMAVVLYSEDENQMLPLGTAWHTGKDQLCYPQPVGCFSTWGWAIRSYSKDDFFRDEYVKLADRGRPDLRWDALYNDFGYNYVHLSPYYLRSDHQIEVHSFRLESATAPANTVMIVSKWSPALVQSKLNWANGFPGGMVADAAVEPPVSSSLPQLCLSNWGEGGFFDQRDPLKGLNLEIVEGRNTGGVASRYQSQAFVGFLDGHVKKLTPKALAVGTNWNSSILAKDVRMTSPKAYLWTAVK